MNDNWQAASAAFLAQLNSGGDTVPGVTYTIESRDDSGDALFVGVPGRPRPVLLRGSGGHLAGSGGAAGPACGAPSGPVRYPVTARQDLRVLPPLRGRSSMVEPQPSKLVMPVRSRSPALIVSALVPGTRQVAARASADRLMRSPAAHAGRPVARSPAGTGATPHRYPSRERSLPSGHTPGHLPQAQETLTAAITNATTADDKQRTVILGDLAVAAAQHDPEGACGYAEQALQQLSITWYATGMHRILEVRKALQPWAEQDCVQALDDQLYGWQATLSTLQR